MYIIMSHHLRSWYMRAYRNVDYECTTMQMLFFQEFEC